MPLNRDNSGRGRARTKRTREIGVSEIQDDSGCGLRIPFCSCFVVISLFMILNFRLFCEFAVFRPFGKSLQLGAENRKMASGNAEKGDASRASALRLLSRSPSAPEPSPFPTREIALFRSLRKVPGPHKYANSGRKNCHNMRFFAYAESYKKRFIRVLLRPNLKNGTFFPFSLQAAERRNADKKSHSGIGECAPHPE